MLRLIEDSLRAKFGEEGVALMPAIDEINDSYNYILINRSIAPATTLDEVRRACAAAAAPAPRRKKSSNGQRGQRQHRFARYAEAFAAGGQDPQLRTAAQQRLS